MTTWVDVVARTRGLSTRLLTPAQCADVARARDLRDLAVRLAAARGQPMPNSAPAPMDLEVAERRRAGAQVRLLARWCGRRSVRLAPLFEEEDCRSIRAAVRGSSGGVPASERLAGLIPTQALPERAIAQVAAAPDPAAVAALLAAWGSPYAAPVLAETSRQQPDLFALEHGLIRTWADRATRARRQDRAMATYVGRAVDVANCWSALLVAAPERDADPAVLFLEGGRLVTRDEFQRAATTRDRSAAAAILDPIVRRSPVAAVTSLDGGTEERVRRGLEQEQRDLARREPLGLAPVIRYWLQLRGEREVVQRIIWAVAVGAPAGRRFQAAS
jgi:vacuolar-type H+-ATPase subunit C/Vma6